MSTQVPITPGPAAPVPPGMPAAPRLERRTGAGAVVAMSLAAGILSGAVAGAGVIGVAFLYIGVADPPPASELGPAAVVLVLYAAIAAMIGGAVGLGTAPVMAVALLVARPFVGVSRPRARVVAAVGAALPGVVVGLCGALPWYAAAPYAAMAAAGGALWARKIMVR